MAQTRIIRCDCSPSRGGHAAHRAVCAWHAFVNMYLSIPRERIDAKRREKQRAYAETSVLMMRS
jgi:hypothetical protein